MTAWTKSEDKTIAAKVTLGWSASRIAAVLIGRTRSAVIGRLYRLGLSSRTKITERATRRAPKFNPKPVPFRKVEDIEVPMEDRMYLLTRNADGKICASDDFHDDRCKWPIGDPRDRGFYFCGKESVPGVSYCELHSRIAYIGPPPVAPKEKPERISTFADSEKELA